jgi:hypothetical protein
MASPEAGMSRIPFIKAKQPMYDWTAEQNDYVMGSKVGCIAVRELSEKSSEKSSDKSGRM